MQTKILKVIAQGEPMYVQSKKSENGGNLALCKFTPGKLVVAALRFQTHESNGAFYQDIVASSLSPTLP